MSPEQRQAEALKSLSDWAKWLISLEVALSVGLTAILQYGNPDAWIFVALVSFVASIFFAASLLGTIPDAYQNLPIKGNIYEYRQFGKVPIRIYAFCEHLFLILGFIALLIFGFSRL